MVRCRTDVKEGLINVCMHMRSLHSFGNLAINLNIAILHFHCLELHVRLSERNDFLIVSLSQYKLIRINNRLNLNLMNRVMDTHMNSQCVAIINE